MAIRSITTNKTIQPGAKSAAGRVETGPSPFPLLILALLIGAILLLRVRLEGSGPMRMTATQMLLPHLRTWAD